MENSKISALITDFYLDRFKAYPPFLDIDIPTNLGISVVIPSFKEPDIIPSLESLSKCHQPQCDVEIIVVINSSITAAQEIKISNQNTLSQIKQFQPKSKFPIHIIDVELPEKTAGVGLARKIGMDEAYRRFLSIDNLDNGVIACFDADSTCRNDYLIELETRFLKSNIEACSIHYEHPIDRIDDQNIEIAITKYELHLRYYMQCLRYAGHPHAYQTIGSSMAVRANAYGKEGGMNKKKAGEDFYFLMKYIQNNKLNELNTTCIYPAARTSDRVPFGTGRAMIETLEGSSRYSNSYNIKNSIDLKDLIDLLPKIYENDDLKHLETKIPDSIRSFIQFEVLLEKTYEFKRISKDKDSFVHRFFVWFNGFQVMKFMHHCRDHYYPNEPISLCCNHLLKKINNGPEEHIEDEKKLLLNFRKLHLDYSNSTIKIQPQNIT